MLEAVFTANIEEIKISGLTQWDRGQMLRISCPDLPAAFQVHFTNRAREKAIPVQAVGADNEATVTIPDEILREPYEVLAHLDFTEGDAGLIGETVKTVRMPITPRAQPEDYIVDLPQEQQTEAEILIDRMMNEHATKAANAAAAGALDVINDALSNLPAGGTLVINDLTVGGTRAALSAEMGKELNTRLIKTETPSLTDAQKKQLQDLANSYTDVNFATRKKFLYNGNILRNVYVGDTQTNKPFAVDDDGETKVSINCGLFCGLLWAGVKPQTFTDYIGNPEGFDGTLQKVTGFDWGYEFKYPNRKAYGLKKADGGLYGFKKPNEDNYIWSSSYNSFYSPGSDGDHEQRFYTYATAADMAWEMFTNGYEIQMKDIDVGDLLFFRARSLSDGEDDYDEAFRFRHITHVGMVSDLVIDEATGQKLWSIAESTPMVGTGYHVTTLKYSSTSNAITAIKRRVKESLRSREDTPFPKSCRHTGFPPASRYSL